ncbi:MAG: hypothetical protein RL577_124 [Bacteroidota bacterium]
MNKMVILSLAVLGIWACQDSGVEKGKPLNEQEAVRIDAALNDFLENEKTEAVVFGRTQEVCQSEGCWFNYELESSSIKALEAYENRKLGPLGSLYVELEEGVTIPTTMNKGDVYCTGTFKVKPSDQDSSQCEVYFRASGVRYKP